MLNSFINQTDLIWKQLGAKFEYIKMKAKEVPQSLKSMRNLKTFSAISDLDPEEEITFLTIKNYH